MRVSEGRDRVDVVVVGAGLSGLVAAQRLADRGKRVRVLEASARVGGRTLARKFGDSWFDVGGQWIGPGQDRVKALADHLGLATFPTHYDGEHLLDVGAGVKRYTGIIPRMSLRALVEIGLVTAKTYAWSALVPVELARSHPRLAQHDALTVEHLAKTLRTPEARGTFDAAFRTVFGAEPRDVSLLWYLFYLRAGGGYFRLVEVQGGAQERRFVRGAHGLSVVLAERLAEKDRDAVRLASPVRRIVQERDEVIVSGDGFEVRAKRAVVAIPPSLLSRITFDPLPARARVELCEGSVMGATVKVIATYPKPFWRAHGLSGQAVTSRGPLSVTFDNTSHDGRLAALVGFVVGDNARRWAQRDERERTTAVLDQLVALYGEQARKPDELVVHDWCGEEWTGGCPVNSPPANVLADRAHALRAVHGLVHWAGTETSTKNAGYLDGAVIAGERAADEVLAELTESFVDRRAPREISTPAR